ncbi:hypothetical protein U9M48_000763 [Paspalum notatum var. saurae]|uniref:Uncharacterized protein n=1 Tax=Paspalum notatum var. saurae TaxID=547442 RepID=A0AAQ3SG65_PASNO
MSSSSFLPASFRPGGRLLPPRHASPGSRRQAGRHRLARPPFRLPRLDQLRCRLIQPHGGRIRPAASSSCLATSDQVASRLFLH